MGGSVISRKLPAFSTSKAVSGEHQVQEGTRKTEQNENSYVEQI